MSIRLFVEIPLVQPRDIVTLPTKQRHYLRNVMRLKTGDVVHLFNGKQGEWEAVYQKEHLQLVQQIRKQPLESNKRYLFFSLFKPARMDWLVEKATEMGATHLVPCISDRTTIRRCNLERFDRIAVEASEQSGRLDIPIFLEPSPLFQHLQYGLAQDVRLFIMVPQQNIHPFASFLPLGSKAVGVVIGPEGGWTPEELASFQNNPDLTLASLGEQTLRAETAGLVALGLLQHMG